MSYLKCARSKFYMQNYFEVNIIKFLKMTKLGYLMFYGW